MKYTKKQLQALIAYTSDKLKTYKKYREVTERNQDTVNHTLYQGRLEDIDAVIEDIEKDRNTFIKQLEAYK